MSQKSIKPNDFIYIKSIKKEGKVLERLKTGDYRIECGSMVWVRPESDLEVRPPSKWKKEETKHKKIRESTIADQASRGIKMKDKLDLHGMRVLDALPIVIHRLDSALMEGVDVVEILHGVGTGALMKAIHDYLKKQSFVKKFELDPANTGVTIVYL